MFLKCETELQGQIEWIYFRELKIVVRIRDNRPEKGVLSFMNLLKNDNLSRIQDRYISIYTLRK